MSTQTIYKVTWVSEQSIVINGDNCTFFEADIKDNVDRIPPIKSKKLFFFRHHNQDIAVGDEIVVTLDNPEKPQSLAKRYSDGSLRVLWVKDDNVPVTRVIYEGRSTFFPNGMWGDPVIEFDVSSWSGEGIWCHVQTEYQYMNEVVEAIGPGYKHLPDTIQIFNDKLWVRVSTMLDFKMADFAQRMNCHLLLT